MKNIFRILMAVAVLLTASCAKEDISSSIGGGEVEVTFTANLQDLGSRAYGDGSQVNTLRFSVYDAVSGEKLTQLCGQKAPISASTPTTVNLVLLKGMKYNITFWADHDAMYDFDGQVVTVDYDNVVANDEERDAFYAYVKEFDPADANADTTIELYRPFAQLNAISTDAADALANSGVTISKSTVKAELYNSFNLTDGTVSNPVEKTLTAGDILSAELLSMNYLFAPAEGYTPNVTFTFENNKNIDFGASFSYVPLKRNYRTNIIGSLLTKPTDFTVEIEAAFDVPAEEISVWDGKSKTQPAVTTNPETGKDEYVVDSASDLAWLADLVNGVTRAAGNESLNIVLSNDIDLAGHNWTPIGFNANEGAGNEKYFTGTFDGNGHTINNLKIDVKDKGGVGFFGAIHNATIKNITFNNVFVKAVESEDDPANTSGAQNNSSYIVGGHTGAVAGYDAMAGEISFENVHVKGLVQIEGETRAAQGQRIGGIFGGRSSSQVSFKNVSVIGDENSYIKGYCSTAGVSGQIQNVATYENVNTDIDVYAVTFGAGGLAGIVLHGSTFTNCSSAGNITLDASQTQLSSYSANYPYRVGGIAGCWSEGGATGVLTLTDCNYTGTLTSIDKDGNSPSCLDYAGYVGRGYGLNGCGGSKVVIDGKEYVQAYNTAAEAGLYIVDGVYEVGTLAALKIVANKVNSGTEYYEGKNIKLIADIDLNNEEWIPIGSATKDHGFCGNFDGNGKKIKNLNITALVPDADNYVYAGLFGVTEGTETAENTIKNLVIENVNISTTGHIVSAAIAYPYYTTVENITVQGDINITGGDYTAGVLAYTRRCVNASNIAINGNTGSTITGRHTVGGVISDIQMNGGLTAAYSNFSASNLTITATDMHVGGISGIISLQTLDGATVKNVTIVCDDVRKGIVSGALGGKSTIKNIVHENVTGATNIVGATYDNGSAVTNNGDVYTAAE